MIVLGDIERDIIGGNLIVLIEGTVLFYCLTKKIKVAICTQLPITLNPERFTIFKKMTIKKKKTFWQNRYLLIILKIINFLIFLKVSKSR